MIEDYFDMRDVEEQQRRRKERREELLQALYAKERLEKDLICKIDLEEDKELIDEYILSNLKVRRNCGVKQKKILFYNYFYNNGNYLRETPFNYNLIRKEEMDIKKFKEKPQVREVRRYKSQKDGKCAHCESEKTPLWRNLNDLIVCNACWLYYKAHGVRRPSKLNEKGVVRRMKKKFQEGTKK